MIRRLLAALRSAWHAARASWHQPIARKARRQTHKSIPADAPTSEAPKRGGSWFDFESEELQTAMPRSAEDEDVAAWFARHFRQGWSRQ